MDRDLSELEPELRAKVERVIERMSAEHGCEVTLVEGYRTPERQRHLYAQGRTRPGPVVTWTTRSLHSEGRAADLKVEGPGTQRENYALLQRTAREEGLDTLGMKDPGHVELRVEGGGRAARSSPTRRRRGAPRTSGPPHPEQAARTARVATAARPAAAAAVAPVAQAAEPARTVRMASALRAPAPPSVPVAPASPPPPRHEGVGGDARVREHERVRTEDDLSAPFGSTSPTVRTASTQPVAPAHAAAGPDTMGRVEQILEARDAFAGLTPQRVTVRLDGTAGPVERIRVEMLDQALRGDVQVSDARLAGALRGDAHEILRTLQERGYDPQSLSVNQVRATADSAREGWSGAMRSEGAAEMLRSLVGAQAGSQAGFQGRDTTGRGHEQPGRQDSPRQGGFNQQSRRDGKKEGR